MTSPALLPTHPSGDMVPRQAAGPRAAAEALEASFLAEMLKATGLGEQENTFSGSAGESHFASFHRDAIAREIVRKGGIGLADVIEASLGDSNDDR